MMMSKMACRIEASGVPSALVQTLRRDEEDDDGD